MNNLLRLMVALVLGAVPAAAWAQVYSGWGPPTYSSSTAGESYARGFADVVRSAGMNNVMNSEAAINYSQARSQEIQNRAQWTDTYFEMREQNRAFRNAERTPRLSTEAAYRVARDAAPARLTVAQLDPLNGAVAWPMVLREAIYKPLTDKLDSLFRTRAYQSGGITPDVYFEIQNTTSDLLALLLENINRYRPNDYQAAKRFVESLAHESRMPTT